MPVMPQYTPFIGNVTKNVSDAYLKRQEQDLAKSAYMGDQNALAELTGRNPQMANYIQQQQRQRKQDDISAAGTQRQTTVENQEILAAILNSAAKLPTFEEAKSYAAAETAKYASVIGEMPPLTEDAYNQVRKVNAPIVSAKDQSIINKNNAAAVESLGGGAFSGTGMDAQVSNILIKGTQNPKFLGTPEYARAWQLANEPTIIRTPQGDIVMRPELPKAFKAPSGNAPAMTPEQAAESGLPAPAPNTPKIEVIPGTGKISADQKDYNKDVAVLKKSYDSMTNYISVLKELGPQMSVGPLNSDDTQRLSSAYKRAMLDAKETNNLGVLNGPDLTIMSQFLGDPIGAMAIAKGSETLEIGASEALKQITDSHASLNSVFEGTEVKPKTLESKKAKESPITANDSNKTMVVNGKTWTFPDEQSYQSAKAAAGL